MLVTGNAFLPNQQEIKSGIWVEPFRIRKSEESLEFPYNIQGYETRKSSFPISFGSVTLSRFKK